MKSENYKKFTIANFVFAFSLALVASLIAPYLVTKGFSESQISLMFAVLPFTVFLFLPLLGRAADKLSRNLIIWIGVLLEIIALLLYVLNGNWFSIVMARFFDALAFSLVSLIIIAKLIDGKVKTRGRDTGWSLSLGSFGQMIGPFFGAFIADKFFIQAPFITAIIILFFLLFFISSKETVKNVKYLPGFLKFSWWSEIKLFLSNRQLKGMGILGMVMHATNPAFDVFLPILIIQKLGFSYSAIGVAMFFYASSHIFQQIFGKWADRIGYWKGVILGTIICATFLIPIFAVTNYLLLVILIFFSGVGSGIWNVSAWSLMSEIGEKMKAECQVLTSYFSIAKLGELISFIVSAFFVKIFPSQSVFLFLGGVILFGNIFAFNYLKPKRKE